MTPRGRVWWIAGAVVTGLALRVVFTRFVPGSTPDTRLYEELARNLLEHGTYGLELDGEIVAVNLRGPGYPAFLAVVRALFGPSTLALGIVQSVLDVATALLVGRLASLLAPPRLRSLAGVVAVWIAATCPFLIQYVPLALTEVPAVFLTAGSLVFFTIGATREARSLAAWFGGGFLAGLGTLVRPDTPLLLAAVGLVLTVRWGRSRDPARLVRAAAAIGLGLAVTLLPWVARNTLTLGRVELFPRGLGKGVRADQFVPDGFYDWTHTWLTDHRQMPRVVWPFMGEDKAPIRIEAMPEEAWDSPAERARVVALLERYNREGDISPALDAEFALLAAERAARRPLRVRVGVPLERAAHLWLGPRFPERRYPAIKLGLRAVNVLVLAVAVLGAWLARGSPVLALGGAFLVVRTAAFAVLTWPEPRFVLECFPVVLALAGVAVAAMMARWLTSLR